MFANYSVEFCYYIWKPSTGLDFYFRHHASLQHYSASVWRYGADDYLLFLEVGRPGSGDGALDRGGAGVAVGAVRRSSKSHSRDPNASRTRVLPIRMAAACSIEPLTQGSLDGLCALYAILNALRLALAKHEPLSRSRSKALFGQGIAFLDGKCGLEAALVDGMGARRRYSLARHLAKLASNSNSQISIA